MCLSASCYSMVSLFLVLAYVMLYCYGVRNLSRMVGIVLLALILYWVSLVVSYLCIPVVIVSVFPFLV
jgi:uncharacterized Tic20 family protein